MCVVGLTTFTLQQEVPPEGDDGQLLVGHLLLLREVDGEEAANRLSRELSGRLAEDAAKGRREELHLDWTRGSELPDVVSSDITGGYEVMVG